MSFQHAIFARYLRAFARSLYQSAYARPLEFFVMLRRHICARTQKRTPISIYALRAAALLLPPTYLPMQYFIEFHQ